MNLTSLIFQIAETVVSAAFLSTVVSGIIKLITDSKNNRLKRQMTEGQDSQTDQRPTLSSAGRHLRTGAV
jgi:hypothetical protein